MLLKYSLRFLYFKNDIARTSSTIRNYRRFSTAEKNDITSYVAVKMNNKRLLRISGCDSFIYLQSLLTNDMRQLLPLDRIQREIKNNKNIFQEIYALDQPIIYSYICNAVCRVLCDLFIYRSRYRAEDNEYILEVDAEISASIKRLLLGFNTSRNIKVEFAYDLDLWSLIPEKSFSTKPDENYGKQDEINTELIEIDSDDIKLVSDPRIRKNNILGYRFLTRLGGKQIEDVGKYCKTNDSSRLRLIEGKVYDYKRLRYKFGISEGIQDHLSGHYYPFELNGDLLNAISLNKGLFTSEEKVIKIYSADGIKNRIFPVIFSGSAFEINQLNPAPRTALSTLHDGTKFGIFHNRIGRFGIATLPVPKKDSLAVNYTLEKMPILRHNDSRLKVKPIVPFWWPSNIGDPQLPIPEYPRCMFNLQEKHDQISEENFIPFQGMKEIYLEKS